MGKQILLIAMLASFLIFIAILGLSGVWDDSKNITATPFEEEQTHNLSATGINMSLSKLRQQSSWRTGFSDLQMEQGGTIDVTLTDIGTDSIRIRSVGTLNNVQHTSIVDVQLSPLIPMAESALAVYGDEVNFNNSGKTFGINGNDHATDGSAGTQSPVYGISVPSPKIQIDLKKQLIGSKVHKNVRGTSGWPCVGVSTITNNQILEMRDFFQKIATTSLRPGTYSGNTQYGNLSSPEIVYINGDIQWTGNVSGTGVLVVQGSLKVGGNWNWTGLVLCVSQDTDLELGDKEIFQINGAAMIGTEVPDSYKVMNLTIHGNPQINYSHSTLSTVIQNLNLINVDILSYDE